METFRQTGSSNKYFATFNICIFVLKISTFHCCSVPYGVGYPAVKHRHHAKVVVIHEYDDKDGADKGYYYRDPTYVHIPGSYEADKDKSKYDFDHDHYHYVHNYGDGDKDGLHSHSYTYGTGFNHGADASDKKSAFKKPNKLPKKFTGKDKGKKFEYSYYDDYSYPTVGFKEDFIKPKHTHKSLDSGYEVKSHKTSGGPLKLVSPTTATYKTYGPTKTTYKTSYAGPTVKTYVDSGYIVSPKTDLPTLVPYSKPQPSTPLNAEFQEYNARKTNTEGYILSNDEAPFAYPVTHLQSPQYDSVKDGIVSFAAEIREQFGGDDLEPDKNTLEQFRKEDEEDAKEHAAFVSSIENDHKAF